MHLLQELAGPELEPEPALRRRATEILPKSDWEARLGSLP